MPRHIVPDSTQEASTPKHSTAHSPRSVPSPRPAPVEEVQVVHAAEHLWRVGGFQWYGVASNLPLSVGGVKYKNAGGEPRNTCLRG